MRSKGATVASGDNERGANQSYGAGKIMNELMNFLIGIVEGVLLYTFVIDPLISLIRKRQPVICIFWEYYKERHNHA
jgi:hypothetical protein